MTLLIFYCTQLIHVLVVWHVSESEGLEKNFKDSNPRWIKLWCQTIFWRPPLIMTLVKLMYGQSIYIPAGQFSCPNVSFQNVSNMEESISGWLDERDRSGLEDCLLSEPALKISFLTIAVQNLIAVATKDISYFKNFNGNVKQRIYN